MSSVTCRYCGLPFRVTRVVPGKDYFCCTGCDSQPRARGRKRQLPGECTPRLSAHAGLRLFQPTSVLAGFASARARRPLGIIGQISLDVGRVRAGGVGRGVGGAKSRRSASRQRCRIRDVVPALTPGCVSRASSFSRFVGRGERYLARVELSRHISP